MNSYNRKEVEKEAIKYFKNDTLSRDVWINKYALKDSDDNIYELTPNDMHNRLASELNRIEEKYPNPLSKDKIFDLIKDFKYIVPQGSPMSGIGNNMQVVSLSNCFVVGNQSDSYGGIMNTDQEQVQLMKRRGGVGHDLSHIRPNKSPVKNSALTSTGVVPFMERYSNSTREVAQDGRRGALMLSISVEHPDAEEFIDAKMEKGKVTGANVSVRINDEFMNCVLDGKPYTQKYPIGSDNPTYTKEINAEKLWKKIVHNAWKSAEPGILFWDTVQRESLPDMYPEHGFTTTSTNPCVVGDTLIAVADGRNAVTIKELVDDGKDVPVYSTNPLTGRVEIKMGRSPRKTKNNTEVWKLTLDDGSEFIATPDHKILLKNLEYVDLKNLKTGDSISPFYSFDSNNYRQISRSGVQMKGGNFRNNRQYRLINEFYNGAIDSKKYHIHHKDYNSKNDSIDNLELMLIEEHKKLHSHKMMGDNNPYHNMSDEWKFNFASHKGENNPRYINISNEELILKGKELFLKKGKLVKKDWIKFAKENKIPQFLGNDFRFSSFNNFKNQVVDNHKVVSVEFYGYEDVYNITVDDNHNYNVITSKEDENYITSSGISVKNCGEIPLCPYDSCRLLAINLYSYVVNPFEDDAYFDFDLFSEHAQYAQRFMDDIVDLEIEKVDKILEKIKTDPEPDEIKAVEIKLWEKIKEKSHQGRRTGLGITAEGDMLAALGYKYGTKDATDFSVEVHKTLAVNAYKSSITMAKERGAFDVWDFDKEFDNPFLQRIWNELTHEYQEMYQKYGRRNIALLTIAPTGSVSIMTQTTSGIEPVFLPVYTRRRKINPNDKSTKSSFIDEVGDHWEEYNVFHPKFKVWASKKGYDVNELEKMKASEIQPIIEKSPYFGASSNDVDWLEKVEMQGRIQKWVDHSISVTVNLPNNVTEELVSNVYEAGWKSGCKGITVYRDGSRSGVLVSKVEKKPNVFQENNAPRRPKSLQCDVIRFTNKGEKWIGFLGLMDNRPYEIFTGLQESVNIPNYIEVGEIIKSKNAEVDGHSRYDLKYIDKDGYVQEFRGLSRAFNREFWNTGRLVSGILRHGMPLPNVLALLDKLDFGDSEIIASWRNGVKRMIKKYIKDGTKISGEECPICHSHNIVFKEGCKTCLDCNWSKCD